MRKFPVDKDDIDEADKLEAKPWMLEQLKLNPSYVWWGPYEDYMWNEGKGWDSRVICDSWEQYSFHLNELNEVVNFYFVINRPTKTCEACCGTGHHPDAQWITESWYAHSSPFSMPDERERQSKAILEKFGAQFKAGNHGRGALPPSDVIEKYGKPFLDHCISTMENGNQWSTNLSQDEIDALWDAGRLKLEFSIKPTAAAVNAWAKNCQGMGHDSINSWICTQQRCKRLGVPYECPACEGRTNLFIGPASLSLVTWVLHPRKGCSRGVQVNNIKESELPAIYAYLREAADRNAQRFALVPAKSGQCFTDPN